jgi:hypothetical protein
MYNNPRTFIATPGTTHQTEPTTAIDDRGFSTEHESIELGVIGPGLGSARDRSHGGESVPLQQVEGGVDRR